MCVSSKLSNEQDKDIVAAMLPSGKLCQHLLYIDTSIWVLHTATKSTK